MVRYYLIAVAAFLAELCLAWIYPSLGLQLFLGIVSVHFVWRACTERAGSASPIGLYLSISAIYVFAALSEVAYFGNRNNLDPLLMGALTDMGTAFLLAVGAGYLLLDKPKRMAPTASAPNLIQLNVSLLLCGFLLLLSISLTIAAAGFQIGSLSRGELYSQNLTFVSVIRSMLAANFGIAAAFLASYEHRTGSVNRRGRVQLFALIGMYVLVDLFILGDRRLPMVAVLAAMTHFLHKRFTWRQILVATVGAVVLFVYGFVRNTPPSTWLYTLTNGQILAIISPTSTEFGGMAIIGQTIGGFANKVWGFPGYLEAFIQVMPRALVPDRPLSPTEWFMVVFYPDLAATGASYAFNQVIEARLNGGIVGILLAGFLTGSIISLCSRWTFLGARIGVSLAIFLFAFSMRMDFASILKSAILALVGIVALLVVVALFHKSDAPDIAIRRRVRS